MTDDADFIKAVCDLAEMALSSEIRGVHADHELDALIRAARRIKEREGYYVEHSVTEPRFGRAS